MSVQDTTCLNAGQAVVAGSAPPPQPQPIGAASMRRGFALLPEFVVQDVADRELAEQDVPSDIGA